MRLECGCPGAYPDWDGKDVSLEGQLAHTQPIAGFFFMPLSFDLYRQRQHDEIQQLEMRERWPGFALTRMRLFGGSLIALLQDGHSPSRRVSRLVPPLQLAGLLHHGGIGTIRKSVLNLQMRLFDQGRLPKELYLSYLTCPRCAETRGGDRILLLRRWVGSPRLAAKIRQQKTL